MKTFILQVHGIIQLTRPLLSIGITLIVVFYPIYIYTNDFYYSLLMMLPFSFTAMAGITLNDYFDYEVDIIDKPYRALPSKIISPHTALFLCAILLGISFLPVVIVSRTWLIFTIYIFTIVSAVLYNFIAWKFAFLKGVFTALGSIAPFVLVFTICQLRTYYYIIPVFILMLGREILMDVRDINGDRKRHSKTIPMIIGIRYAIILGHFLLATGFVFLNILIFYNNILFCLVFNLSVFLFYLLLLVNKKRAALIELWIPFALSIIKLWVTLII